MESRTERLGGGGLQLAFVHIFQRCGDGAHVQLDAPGPVLHIPNFLGKGGGIRWRGPQDNPWKEFALHSPVAFLALASLTRGPQVGFLGPPSLPSSTPGPREPDPGQPGWGGDRVSKAHLKCLVEVLHHPDPLACLLGKLGSLHLQGLHLVVQLPLVHVGLGHTKV